MSDSQQKTFAERLGAVQVGVRAELTVSRHVFGKDPAYVIQDPLTFQSHRFSVDDYQIFLAINADEPLQNTFERLVENGSLQADQQEDFFRFILQLSQLGLLSLPLSDGGALYQRYRRKLDAKKRSRFLSLLFLRVPLLQPDVFLTRTSKYFNFVFTRRALLVWAIAMFAACVTVYSRWQEFRSPLGTILAIQNLPILWTLLVGLKTFHEFGHAYACKRFGGHVPEMGAYFIIGTPCAYVDATAAWGFPNRWHRIMVSMGGMYFESIAAIIAVFVWNLTGPGPLNSAAQYTVLLSTAVTIAFNANPLMKYDGYYVLSDLLEIPNLRGHSQRELSQFMRRWLLNAKPEQQAKLSPKRRLFMLVFGLLGAVYKLVVVFGIAITIAFKIPAAGITIAGLYVFNSLRQSLGGIVTTVRSLPNKSAQIRATATVTAVATTILVGIVCVPLPTATHVHGVVGNKDEFVVHAQSAGFLLETPPTDGEPIDDDAIVCRLQNQELVAALESKAAEIEQLRIQVQRELNESLTAAATTQKRLEKAAHEKREYERAVERLVVRTPSHGVISIDEKMMREGSFLQRGEPVATIRRGDWVIRTLTTATQLSATKPQIGDTAEVLLPAKSGQPITGTIIEISPAGSQHIGQAALTHVGGGEIAVEATTQEAKEPYFEVVVKLNTKEEFVMNGMTAWVKLATPAVPVGTYLYRSGLNLLNHLRLAG